MAAIASTASGSLSVTLAHAITYLTRSLVARYSAHTIIQLQLSLEANLTAQFAPTWVPAEPLRGSGRRCLTLSPRGLPPRAIYNACKAARVEWSEWIALLGGMEFDLFVDPGCISIRFGNWDSGRVTKNLTVWSEAAETKVQQAKTDRAAAEAQLQAQLQAQVKARAAAAKPQGKTLAQQLLESDEDDELFALIADEVREPTWITPILEQFPAVPVPHRSASSSPVSICSSISTHSRASSSSSISASIFSSVSDDSSVTAPSLTSYSGESQPKLSRRERARQTQVFVDTSKTAVTNYDGGKTTVLTGGVMLGGVAPAARVKSAPVHKKTGSSISSNWRSVRA